MWQERLLIAYVLLFYFAVEISPLKPHPDYMRYIIPIVPVMIYFAYRGIQLLSLFKLKKPFIILITIISMALPLYETIQLVYHLNKDTRYKADQWIKSHGGMAIFEQYAIEARKSNLAQQPGYQYVKTLADLDLEEVKNKKIPYLVASSFMYDRYFLGSKLKNQPKEIYRYHQEYELLFKYPITEIKPDYKSFAFSNPTIRILDIRNEPAESY
jgi:hypothetical protein